MRLSFLALVIPVVFAAASAQAQSQAGFVTAFSGQWQIYEQRLSSGQGLCTLDFSGLGTGNRLPLKTSRCAAPLSNAVSWGIEGNQMVLYDVENAAVVNLGGNQKRVTGATPDGTPIILERAGGDGSAATLQAAYNASGCYYLGYTQACASRSELGEPLSTPDGRMRIHLEANLSAHAEPRADADTIGVVQQDTCIVVDRCTMASDGPWCRAEFGTTAGWLRKLSLRQNRWAVVAFTNAC